MSRYSRRRFLQSTAALGALGGLGWSSNAWAAPPERKFLFFFAGGGWDTVTVLDPHIADQDHPKGAVDMDEGTDWFPVPGWDVNGRAPADIEQVSVTGGPDREAVERYFTRWSQRTAAVNGMNMHSVGHDSATQFAMTGTAVSSFSDWPTILAAASPVEYPLPHVVFSGPSFPGTQAQAVVRAGGGTLLGLLDGSLIGRADRPAPIPAPPADSMLDAFVHKRVEAFAQGQRGLSRIRADAMLSNLERTMELEGRQFEAGLSDLGNNILDQAMKATELFRLGLSRCAMIRIPGGWDSHGNNMVQAPQQDAFYNMLDQLMDHLQATPGDRARWLIDEVVVVAMSEIGRTPGLNPTGKDHWPYSSALVAGSGVAPGKFGHTDPDLIGTESLDLTTGHPVDGADTQLGCENLGVALLKLGGIDPEKHRPGIPALDAVVRKA